MPRNKTKPPKKNIREDDVTNEIEIVRWVARNLHRVNVSRKDQPCEEAYNMLKIIQEDESGRLKRQFFFNIWPRLINYQVFAHYQDRDKKKQAKSGEDNMDLEQAISEFKDVISAPITVEE